MKSLWYFFSNFDNTIWFQIKHLFWTAACHKKIYLLVQDRILFYNFQNPCLPTTNNFYIFVNVISCWLLQHSYLIYRRWNLDMTVKVFAINFAIFYRSMKIGPIFENGTKVTFLRKFLIGLSGFRQRYI